jgi:hypothetical protein
MDEGAGQVAADDGPNGADLSTIDVAWVSDGQAGSALGFNQGSGATGPASSLHTADLTVTLWVRGDPAHPPVDGSAIVELGGRAGCGHATWGIYVEGSTFVFGWQDAEAGQFYQTGGFEVDGHALWDGDWHLISVAASTKPYVYLYQSIDQRPSGFTQMSPAFDYSGLTFDVVSVGRRAGNCGTPPSFRGEVDDLRIYDKQLTGDQVGGLMEPVSTTTVLSGPATRLADETGCFEATVAPIPGGGTVSLSITPAGGATTTYSMNWEVIGIAQLCTDRDAGDYTVVANYVAMRPWLPSASNVIDLHVSKRISSVSVTGRSQQLSTTPLLVDGTIDGHGVVPTGTIDFYEEVGGDRVHLGSQALAYAGASFTSGATLQLPARPAGTYTFEIDYGGDKSHEPSTGTGELIVTEGVVIETVAINGGEVATSNPIVNLTTQASGAARMAVSLDGYMWKTFDPYQASIADWSLTDPAYGGTSIDGVKTVHVRWYNAFNEGTGDATASIILDRASPATSSPANTVVAATSVTNGKIPVRLAWTGSDATSGIDHYLWSQQTDDGGWSSPASVATASMSRFLAPGHRYRFRVSAVDRAGNIGSLSSGSTFTLRAVSQSAAAVHYRGTWSTSTSSIWWGGTARRSATARSTVSLTFTGKSIAWVGLKAATRGKAEVYINGVFKATVDLYSASTLKQRIVWSANYASSATRTITIKVLGTSHRPRVDVDGFIVGS